VNGGKLCNEELHDLYCSPSIIWMSKSKRMRWPSMWHAWGEEKCIYSFGGETSGMSSVGRLR